MKINLDTAVLRAIRNRRSTVRFKPVPVEEEKIDKILEAGRWAPSYLNSQPWEFIVVNDPQIKNQLCQIGVRITLFSQGIKDSSVVIVVVVDPEKDPYHYIEDGSVATHNMALAAHSLGLATYWIGVHNIHISMRNTPEEAVKEIMNIPKELRVLALLPIGVPAFETQSERKRLDGIVHRNQYAKK